MQKNRTPSPSLHSHAWALPQLVQSPPTEQSVRHFDKEYYSFSPHDDNGEEGRMSMYTNRYQSPIIARNLFDSDVMKSLIKFIVDSGVNRHMCNNRNLFISFVKYKGGNNP